MNLHHSISPHTLLSSFTFRYMPCLLVLLFLSLAFFNVSNFSPIGPFTTGFLFFHFGVSIFFFLRMCFSPFNRSWLYCPLFREGAQISYFHFFFIHISYRDHETEEIFQIYHFKKNSRPLAEKSRFHRFLRCENRPCSVPFNKTAGNFF